nr:hypothetical protein [Kibdelosporangium sp. MJ126-NF4]
MVTPAHHHPNRQPVIFQASITGAAHTLSRDSDRLTQSMV